MRILPLLLAIAFPCGLAQAQPEPPLRVGIFERAPFAMKDAQGRWDGLAVNAWQKAAAQLGLPYTYVELPESRALAEVAAGGVDVLMGELAVSAERADRVRFSQPYAIFPEAVALPRDKRFPVLHYLARVLENGLGEILLIMLGAMVVFSLLLWFVERKVDRTHFGGHPAHGFGSALWFAAVTMTTVGYGDKTPQTASGRVLVFFWMLFGVVAISVFTGTVASSVAIAHLDNSVATAADLSRYRNGVLADSLTQSVLGELGISAQPFPTIDDGLRALESGRITAFIGNESSLRYMANHSYSGRLTVAPIPNTHVSYAFAVRPGLRDASAIDAAIIAQTARPGWAVEEQRYLGPPAN